MHDKRILIGSIFSAVTIHGIALVILIIVGIIFGSMNGKETIIEGFFP